MFPGFLYSAATKLLLLHAEDDTTAAQVKAALVGTGKFTNADIDLFSIVGTTPTLTNLQGYQCVYTWTDYNAANPLAVGDVLKQYVLGGGKVLLMVYAISSPSSSWLLTGGIMDPGFNPLRPTTNNFFSGSTRSLDFSTALTSQPILSGVTTYTFTYNSNSVAPTLDPGALLIAKDDQGVPHIAISASGQVGAINVYPGYPENQVGGVIRTIANACDALVGFNVCIKDQRGMGLFQVNSTTGAYLYYPCGSGTPISGQGQIIPFSQCQAMLIDTSGGQAVKAVVNTCNNSGAAGGNVFQNATTFFVFNPDQTTRCACQ
jgi:hypothetical protein